MSSIDEFDIVVIGGGPGGEATAAHAAKAGARVVLVERELVGGECPYWGCMPSKALLRPGQVLTEAARHPGVKHLVDGTLDPAAVFARRDEIVRNLDDTSHAERIERNGIEIIRGHGRIAGERHVKVDLADGSGTRELTARRAVVIAPGTRAGIPPIPGLEDARPWTNREATLASHAPRHLVVIGGGVIAVELAYAFHTLGSLVTIVEAADRLLGREEPEAAELVTASLRSRGIQIACGSKITSVVRADGIGDGDGDGEVRVEIEGRENPIIASEVLVATGRVVNSEDLGLDSIGVTPGRSGAIEVTTCMQVAGHEWLYVVGDANGRAQLTHSAVYQAKVAARNAVGLETHCIDDEFTAPRVIFTEPNVTAVGHTLASAEAAGLRVRTFDRDPQRTAASTFYGRGTEGFARLVVDLDAERIVGATFVGVEIAELLHAATVAIVGHVPPARLRHCVAPFPTRSDVWNRLIDMLEFDPDLGVLTPN